MATQTAPIAVEQAPAPPAVLNEKTEPTNVEVAELPAVNSAAAETPAAAAVLETNEKSAEAEKPVEKTVEPTPTTTTTEEVTAKVEELKVEEPKAEAPKEAAAVEEAKVETQAAEKVEEKTMEATAPTPAAPAVVEESPIVKAAREKELETGKKYTIFEHPTESSKPAPHPALTEVEQAKYAKVLSHFEALEAVPVSSEKGAATAPLEDFERMFLTKECFERFLRAAKWDVDNAIKRLEATLVWRREYGTNTFTREYIEPEQETGKQWSVYYDKEGRVCHVLNPSRQNTEQSPKQIEHLIYMLERDIELMPPGQATIALVIDFGQVTRDKRTPISTAKAVLHILQNHYPERLGKALIINIPWFINAFFKLITPFIDPVTRQKLVFNEDLTKHIPAEQLEKRFGGQVDWEYDHAVYWTHLHEVAGRRKEEYTARWVARGKKIGDSEFVLKGGVEAPAAEVKAE